MVVYWVHPLVEAVSVHGLHDLGGVVASVFLGDFEPA